MTPSFAAEKVAKLAKLHLRSEEVAKLQKDVESILKFVDTLNNSTLTGVEPFFGVESSDAPPIRPDKKQRSLERKDALANAPQSDDEHFLVPAVFESQSDVKAND